MGDGEGGTLPNLNVDPVFNPTFNFPAGAWGILPNIMVHCLSKIILFTM